MLLVKCSWGFTSYLTKEENCCKKLWSNKQTHTHNSIMENNFKKVKNKCREVEHRVGMFLIWNLDLKNIYIKKWKWKKCRVNYYFLLSHIHITWRIWIYMKTSGCRYLLPCTAPHGIVFLPNSTCPLFICFLFTPPPPLWDPFLYQYIIFIFTFSQSKYYPYL